MKTQIKKLSKSQIEIEIELSSEEFTGIFEETIFNLGKDLEIEGFRKGKVPKEIIERDIGQEKILKEAAERAIKESYVRVVLENKIEVLGQPEIEILPPTTFQENRLEPATSRKSGGGFKFRAKTAVLPEIQLPDYRKIASQIRKREVFVEEKEIEEALKWLQKSRAKFSQIERSAQKGDFVEIEFDCPQIENGKRQKDGFLLSQGHLILGFEEKLEGMKQGEEKEFSLEFPEQHFQKNVAGQRVNFRVKMISVQKMELPEINDQFAKSLGQFEDLNSLKENIKKGIKLEKGILEKQRIRQEILQKIVEEISWEIPETLIEAEKNRIVEDLKKQVADRLKISFEQYLEKINKSEKDLKDSFQAEAERRIKNFLILKEISKNENIKVSEEEIKEEINKILKNYPDIAKTEKELDPQKLKDYYEEVIKNEKVFQLLESLTLK